MVELIEIFPGVHRHTEHYQAVYPGPADALIAAGLTLKHPPGQQSLWTKQLEEQNCEADRCSDIERENYFRTLNVELTLGTGDSI